MVLDIEKPSQATVRCLHCKRAVPLPPAVLKRKNRYEAEAADSSRELSSAVFLLRCGVCRKEALYLFEDVLTADTALGCGA
jgi:ribosomal protein S26